MYCKTKQKKFSARTTGQAGTRRRRRRGFSFIEVMVVVVIIGMLAGAVAFTVTDYMTAAKINRAKSDIATIVDAVDGYYLLHHRYPSNEEGLDAVKQLKTYTDPWGNPYQYNTNPPEGDEPYEVYTLGEDGLPGGEGVNADIYSWQLHEQSRE